MGVVGGGGGGVCGVVVVVVVCGVVCVCVWGGANERASERARKRGRERGRKGGRERDLQALRVLCAIAQRGVGVIAVYQLSAATRHFDHHSAWIPRSLTSAVDRMCARAQIE